MRPCAQCIGNEDILSTRWSGWPRPMTTTPGAVRGASSRRRLDDTPTMRDRCDPSGAAQPGSVGQRPGADALHAPADLVGRGHRRVAEADALAGLPFALIVEPGEMHP